MKPSVIVTAIFLFLVSLAHLFRLILHVKVMVNAVDFPLWPSIPAFIVTAALAVWLLVENKK
jgi:hypothetical protein